MAAGRMTGPTLITFTAMILAVMRQVTKTAVITIKRCETFIFKSLNPALMMEEVEHASGNQSHKYHQQDERYREATR